MIKENITYKITNPYENVSGLLSNTDHHYKTNLHTHSTYSDANDSMRDMIEAFYDNDFDILAFAEHGILGKEWDKEPTIIPLFRFQNLLHGKRHYLTTEQYKAVLSGTYKTEKNIREKKSGLKCVPNVIEANMVAIMKNHVNGYFTDDACEGLFGKENDFETPIMKIERSGGISHINHPTDWLGAYRDAACANVPENIAFFADLLRRYKSCLGIEVFNMYDIPNRSDRILWDKLLKTLIPEGERLVWGFANSDAHRIREVDTSFMDFILPEYSLENLRKAMENGNFFAVSRYAKNELGENFAGKGAYPRVIGLKVDDEADTITIEAENCKSIEWIADGEIIASEKKGDNGKITMTLSLRQHSDKISCYVRAQIKGDGGICLSQPFVCDDGDIARFKKSIPVKRHLSTAEKRKKNFYNTRLGVIINKKRVDHVVK